MDALKSHLIMPGSAMVLDSSKRTQGCLLRLGQPLDPRDIEPLIRTVRFVRLEMLACLRVPYLDSPVVAAASQLTPVRTPPQRLDRSLVGFAHPDTLAGAHVPPAQHTGTIAADQHVLI